MTPVETSSVTIARTVASFIVDERGATSVEYALIASGVAVAIAGTVWNLGTSIKTTLYDKISTALP